MNKTNKAKGVFEILLVIGLILIIPLFFAIRTAANKQVTGTATPNREVDYLSNTGTTAVNSPETSTAVPVMSTASETAEANFVKTSQQPPQCTFPLAQITTVESTPEEYILSEPQVVLTAPKGNVYNLAEWLPDSQQVLMTKELRHNPDGIESIELYNPETGESKVYAVRPITHLPPAWQTELNAVVYPIMKYFDVDKKNRTYKFTRQLWVSDGNPDTAQILANNLPQLPFAIKPGGSEMVYLSDKKASKLNKSLKEIPSAPFDPIQWDYAMPRRNNIPVSYKMAWQPGTSLIFLYSEGAMQGGGYTFILDTTTGYVCELNLGGWAEVARWSLDGRYLAFIRSTRYAFPTYSAELTVLDAVTGNLVTLKVTPQEIEGLHLVNDFVWAPDNRHLLALGEVYSEINTSPGQNEIRLYLVDFVSGQSVDIISSKFYTNSPLSMAWSPDGSKLLIRCPTNGVDRICFLTVQRTGR